MFSLKSSFIQGQGVRVSNGAQVWVGVGVAVDVGVDVAVGSCAGLIGLLFLVLQD
jgi:hypothetical protein